MTDAPALFWVRVRVLVVAGLVTGLFGAVAAKAYSVQVRQGARLAALGRAQHESEVTVPAPRGSILDRNGVELAVTVAGESVAARPREVADVAAAAAGLGRVLGLDPRDLEGKLSSAHQFVWIKRRLTAAEADGVRRLGLAGVSLVSEPRRFYPGGDLAGPLIGFADLDGVGLEGVERSFDEELRGDRATVPVVRDARGQLLLSACAVGDPSCPELGRVSAGATLTLTIDRFIQFTAERAIGEAVRARRAASGTVVVLDPRSGDILALASAPTFDPNDPRSKKDARLRAITDAYEAGSVMKTFSIAAAIDAGAVRADEVFDVEGGRLTIGRKTITDTHLGARLLSVAEILKVSSNVGAVKIARRLGRDGLAAALARFGFGARTGVELPGERSGLVRDPQRWGEIGLASAAYGYGFTATPLQIAEAMAAVANGGELVPAGVVRAITAADGTTTFTRRAAPRRVLAPETAAAVARMLAGVLEKGGTGEKLVVPGFRLAGKTGTAHKVDPETGRYADDRYLASFAGFAPAVDPRLVIVVIIDDPRSKEYFGGLVAGPVFSRVAEESLKYLGVAADPELVPPAPRPAAVEAAAEAPSPILDEDDGGDVIVIPDFAGESVAQVLAAARAAGVDVEIEGSGRAVAQFPRPGRALRRISCRVTFDPG